MFKKNQICIFYILLSFLLCGCNNNDDFENNQIKLLSPKDNQSIEYSYVTLEIDATNIESVTAKNTTTDQENSLSLDGFKNNNVFYIYNVPLVEKENQIDLIAIDNNGSTIEHTLSLTSQAKGVAVFLEMNQREGYEKLTTDITIKTSTNPLEYLLDKEGNNIIDQAKTNVFSVTYNEEGQFIPKATIRTEDNVLFTTIDEHTLPVNIKAKPQLSSATSVNEQIFDIEKFNGFIYALANTYIYKFDENDNSVTETILLDSVSSPKGFCYDTEENLYVVDTDNDRVIRLLKASGYQGDPLISPDGSFGSTGSSDGFFNKPIDCMVDSSKNDEKIFVLDSGNNRVQVFNRAGIFLSKFDGNDTTEGGFNNPQGIVANSTAPIIADTGNNLIRLFYQNGKQKRVFGKDTLKSPTKLSFTDKGLLITDTGNKRILITTTFGYKIKELETSNIPSAAINYITDKDITLVSYQGNNEMERFITDSDASGATPEKVVEKFVNAILSDERKQVENMIANPSIMDRIYSDQNMFNILKEHLIIVNEYILNSKSKIFAGVTITFKGTEDILPVGLIKENDQWFINKF